MRGEPFDIGDAKRVLAHPDTPAAYVEWLELLPLTGLADRTHLGNLLEWSYRNSCSPLGASRRLFERALFQPEPALLDRWMQALANTSSAEFLDHHIPFLRNASLIRVPEEVHFATGAFLDACAIDGFRSYELRTGDPRAASAPESVIIEITRSCNFACRMCSSRTNGFLAEQTMPLPVFGEIVRILSRAARSLRVNGYGETGLVPDLPRYLDCLDEFRYSGIREIITNLSAPAQIYEDLVRRGFVVLASWDATRADLFERIRVGSRYAEVLDTLRAVGKLVSSMPERLGLLCTVQEENLGEVVPMVRHAAEVGAGLVIFNMVNEDGGSPWMSERFAEIRDSFAAAASLASELGVTVRIPDHIGGERLRLLHSRRTSATFCDRPWRELLVRWDTELTVCNMFNPFSYGVLQPPGPPRDAWPRLQRLWTGPNARVFRGLINSKHAHPYCKGCYYLYA